MVTEFEFLLRSARALSPATPEQALGFLVRALDHTVDPRLRFLMTPALSALERRDPAAARKWLDRACEYERARHDRLNRSLTCRQEALPHRPLQAHDHSWGRKAGTSLH
ncbi:MAG: hypothetical protein WA633_03400 [Stellaceae bacterium]